MEASRQILFNHIPKTGGVTLRIILNRVYGTENIFLIRSTGIGSSIREFEMLPPEAKSRYSVVAGHGAGLLASSLSNPFCITLLREPVSLFISQYFYLKSRKDSGFYNEVNGLGSLDEYLGFAIRKGQDNLLTRYLSDSVQFLADPDATLPRMAEHGDLLLQRAIGNLRNYEAVIDLADFDRGIFALSKKLGWKRIPIYRTANRNRNNPGKRGIPAATIIKLREMLRWDIALYETFTKENLNLGNSLQAHSTGFRLFSLRQKIISLAAAATGRK